MSTSIRGVVCRILLRLIEFWCHFAAWRAEVWKDRATAARDAYARVAEIDAP